MWLAEEYQAYPPLYWCGWILQGQYDESAEQMETWEIVDVEYYELGMATSDGQRVVTDSRCSSRV